MEKSISEILGELINIKFDANSKNNNEIIEYLKNQFAGAVEIATVKNKNGFKNLIIGVNTNLSDVKDAIILSGHMDTICPSESWDNDLKITDKTVFGLGACDMKAYIAELIYRFDFLREQSYPIIISLTSDEETTVEGVQNVLAFYEKRKISGKYFIIGEPTNSAICSSHKGMVDVVVKITGKTHHSSAPSQGINAIYIASKFAGAVEKMNKEYEPKKSSLNVSRIKGGVSGNSVAQNCSIYMDFRALNHIHHTEILERIYKIKNSLLRQYKGSIIDIDIKFNLPCFQEQNSEITRRLCDVFDEEAKPFTAWTEAGYLSSLVPNGIIFGAGSLKYAHKENEQISLEQLEVYDDKFIKVMNEYKEMYSYFD